MIKYSDHSSSGVPENVGGPSIPLGGGQWLPSSNGETSIDSIFRLVRRYFWLVAICILLGVSYAAFKNARSTPLYRAIATIQLTQDSANQFRIDQGAAGEGSYIDSVKLDTEIAIIESATLAMETIKSLHLDKNKDFATPPPGHKWDLASAKDRHDLISILRASLNA